MNEPTPKTGCPSTDRLSEYVDGNVSEEIRNHLKECAYCRRIVDIYSMMDDSIATLSTPPEDLSARITLYCRRQAAAEAQAMPVMSWQRMLRYAAAITLVGAVGAFIYAAFPHGSSRPASNGAAPVARTPDLVPAADGASTTTLVGTQKPAIETAPAAAIKLPDAVHHVWYANNLEKARLELTKIAGTAAITAENNDTTAKRYTATLAIKDEALQGLVSKFAETGSMLLTPDYPQPEADARLEFNGHQITYTLDIVYDL
jgi:hypothetical protein